MEQQTVGFQLSLEQKQLWAWHPGRAIPVVQMAVHVRRPLEVERLKRAFEGVVKRHEILRTTFKTNPGMRFPFQFVSDSPAIDWQEISSQEGEIDLQHGPVLQVRLTRKAADRHLLTVRVPCLCADEATLNKLLGEVRDFYADPSIDVEPAFQYVDYAGWQMDQLGDPETKKAGAPDSTLPFAHKREDGADISRAVLKVPLDSQCVQSLLSQHVDPAGALLAAWQVVLWRLTLNPSFAAGVVADGRTHDELVNAFGPYSRVISINDSLVPDEFFENLTERLPRQLKAAQAEADSGLTARWPSIGFNLQSEPVSRCVDGVEFSPEPAHCNPGRFELELSCIVGHSGLQAEIGYDRHALWGDGAERLALAFSTLLKAAALNPATPVVELEIIDPTQALQIQSGFEGPAQFSSGKCIQQLFEEQVRRTPNRPALRCGDDELSFAALNERANRLANFLRKNGVTADTPVGLCTGRSTGMIVGLLAILKAGGCYVPLLPDLPKQRLLRQISETGIRIVVTQEKLRAVLPEADFQAVCLDQAEPVFDGESPENLALNTAPGNLAYVIYTSGSTGAPKGVAVPHSSLVNYSEFLVERLNAADDGRGLHFATVSTIGADLGNSCIFPALISGGCLHVIAYETSMDAGAFAEYFERHAVDVLKITPSHLKALLAADRIKPVWPRKHLILGGEVLTWDLASRIGKLASCNILNHYGPTEATVGCCTFAPSDNDTTPWQPATVPIGRAIGNTRIYIVDSEFNLVPVGVPGELCIGGAGLARGYIRQPELTNRQFVKDPFTDDAAARLYRTGDLARFLPDGNIEFLGRIDSQIKIRGYRIEAAEIEGALKRNGAIREAVVLPYEDATGEKLLAAYIVASPLPPTSELRAFLSQSLPDYMLPSLFVAVERIPLTPNGKVDMQALALRRQDGFAASRDCVTPRNPSEEKVAAIWSEVLKQPCSDVHANFFDLGGHSLLATQITSRIRDAFQVQLPLHVFLRGPTIADLTANIGQYERVEPDGDIEELIARLEALPEEEAERLLAEMERA